ncbi:IolE/MocC family protein [Bacillus solitudinis]|uniref:hypothetical protein n=1 Tax=Bacillus solitudinis TaxID=2014074 RepID=UPI000C24ED9E|nr:hypothetical protein [Bacillus solitudinis]
MRKINLISLISITLLVFVGCSQQPDIDINETIGKSEDYLIQLEEIETTTSAFDGKNDIKFRLMVEGHPTEKEAIFLFNEILVSFIEYSNHQNIWEYYNGYFDMKSSDSGVIYEATKVIDEELQIAPR